MAEGKYRKGDVVYFADGDRVQFGVVDQYDSSGGLAYIDLLELPDYRYVNGIPVADFQTEEEWHKLPKGWSYDTELFRIEDRTPQEVRTRRNQLRIDRPEDIRAAIEEGILVYACENYHGVIEAEIDRHKGWRIAKHYPAWTLNYAHRHQTYVRVKEEEMFGSYKDAARYLCERRKAKEELANLTDEEWSWKEIKAVLRPLQEVVQAKCERFLSTLPDIDDVEIRRKGRRIEWRRFNKRTPWEVIPDVEI